MNLAEKNERRRTWRKNPDVAEKEAAYAREYNARPEVRARARERQRRWRAENTAKWLLSVARERAKKAGIAFGIETISIPEVCPILGIPLFRIPNRCNPNSPSIDRIEPALGYVDGNVQVISMRANAMKNDASLQELVAMGRWAEGLLHG